MLPHIVDLTQNTDQPTTFGVVYTAHDCEAATLQVNTMGVWKDARSLIRPYGGVLRYVAIPSSLRKPKTLRARFRAGEQIGEVIEVELVW